jgi:hypothetical protein
MANYYDYIGVRPDATREEIEKAIALTEVRLKQTGAINSPQAEINLRNTRETLLDPELRKAYNEKLGLTSAIRAERKAVVERKLGARPARRWQLPQSSRTQRIIAMGVLIVVFGAYLGYTHWQATRIWPNGSVLLSIDDGQPDAVILDREADHVDFAGRHLPAYRIKVIKTGQIIWAGDKQVHAQWKRGGQAPASLLQDSK